MSDGGDPASQVTSVTTDSVPAEEITTAPTPRRVRREGNRWFIPLVFLPLVLYAIGATVFVAWALVRFQEAQKQGPPDPFDQLPDDGDDQGTRKGGKRVTLAYPSEFVTRPLPPEKRVKLGDTLRVGSLEVAPLRVTRERISVMVHGFEKPEQCSGDSLVLYLKLKNVSTDERFAPLDTYFDRCGSLDQGTLPLTYLEVGPYRISGPAQWVSPTSTHGAPQWIKGRDRSNPEGIGPNEELKLQGDGGKRNRDPFICTDGNNPEALKVLFGEDDEGKRIGQPHPGPFLWRIQLRRGVVLSRGKERSGTTVIGVEFTRADITRPQDG
jgi:hypothetical protein